MPLEVQNVNAFDFEDMAQFDDINGDGLVAPAILLTWPAEPSRQVWSLNQQRDIFLADPTARFVKVVDTDRAGEIVALGRWHFYEDGYQHPEMTLMELRGSTSEETPLPAGFNVALFEALMVPLFEERHKWMKLGPQWVLTTLVTRYSQRRRGAGGLLVKWGLDKAQQSQVPAYIEASAAAKSLYEKFGFIQVGELRYDLTRFGFSEPFTVAKMAFIPEA